MPLTVGSRLGHYDGDTTLDQDVVLKVLPHEGDLSGVPQLTETFHVSIR